MLHFSAGSYSQNGRRVFFILFAVVSIPRDVEFACGTRVALWSPWPGHH